MRPVTCPVTDVLRLTLRTSLARFLLHTVKPWLSSTRRPRESFYLTHVTRCSPIGLIGSLQSCPQSCRSDRMPASVVRAPEGQRCHRIGYYGVPKVRCRTPGADPRQPLVLPRCHDHIALQAKRVTGEASPQRYRLCAIERQQRDVAAANAQPARAVTEFRFQVGATRHLRRQPERVVGSVPSSSPPDPLTSRSLLTVGPSTRCGCSRG